MTISDNNVMTYLDHLPAAVLNLPSKCVWNGLGPELCQTHCALNLLTKNVFLILFLNLKLNSYTHGSYLRPTAILDEISR